MCPAVKKVIYLRELDTAIFDFQNLTFNAQFVGLFHSIIPVWTKLYPIYEK